MQADTSKALIVAPTPPTKEVTPLADPSQPKHKSVTPLRSPMQSPRNGTVVTPGKTAPAVPKLGVGHLTGIAAPAEPSSKVSSELLPCTPSQHGLPIATVN